MSEAHAYLVDDVGLTVRLLDEPLEWRVRAVDELLVDAASSCRHRRSLHCGSIREFLPQDLDIVNLIAMLMGVLAIGLVAANVQGARDVALVAAPASIAASVLSARESSTLGSRLRLLNSALIAGSLAALVLAATLQLIRS